MLTGESIKYQFNGIWLDLWHMMTMVATSRIRVFRSSIVCVMFCISLFVLFPLAIVLSVLRFTASVYPLVSPSVCYIVVLFNNRLLDYYKIISISRPIMARANMGLDFVSGQCGCLFSRCRKYVINSLIHGHFHIGLVIIPRPILALDCVSDQHGGLGMITRPIWKCPCINL
jgi:hypothetical protein